MKNKNLREKLLNDKELLKRSVKENSQFSTADLLNIVADLIDYTLNDNDLDNKNISLDDACESMDINIIKKLMQLEEDKKNSRMISPTETPEHFNLRKFQSKNFINDLIAKYKKEKESFMYSLANLTEDFIDDLEKIKGVIDE
jgi:hypothetical protein